MTKSGFFIVNFLISICVFGCNSEATPSTNDSRQLDGPTSAVNVVPTASTPSYNLKDCKLLFSDARLASIKNDIDEARDKYREAFQNGCDNPDSRLDYGTVLARMAQWEDASEQYRVVARQDDKNWHAHWALAQVLIINLSRFEEGLEEIQMAKKLDDLGDIGYNYDYFLGRAFEGLNRSDEAMHHYKAYIAGQTKVWKDEPKLAEANRRVIALKRNH